MAEFVGGEPISVGADEPITFKNKTDTAFDVGCGIVFRKSGLYRVSIVGRHMSVAIEPEREKGKWLLSDEQRLEDTRNGNYLYFCSNCLRSDVHAKTQEVPYCWWCGAKMEG